MWIFFLPHIPKCQHTHTHVEEQRHDLYACNNHGLCEFVGSYLWITANKSSVVRGWPGTNSWSADTLMNTSAGWRNKGKSWKVFLLVESHKSVWGSVDMRTKLSVRGLQMEISSELNPTYLHKVVYWHRWFINGHCPHQINKKERDEKTAPFVYIFCLWVLQKTLFYLHKWASLIPGTWVLAWTDQIPTL